MNEAKEPLTIAIDVDDVLLDLNNSLHPHHNRNYGTSIVFEELTTFDLHSTWGCEKEEAVRRVFAFYESDEFSQIEPIDGAQDVLSKLSPKIINPFAVTSRPHFLFDKTSIQLENHFPGLFTDKLHLTGAFGDSVAKRLKSEVCQEIDAKIILDDYIENARDCAQAGIKTFLFRRPWNRQYSDVQLADEGIIPVENWSEFKERILI